MLALYRERPPGRRARGLPGDAAHARGRARDRAGRRVAGARAGDPSPGPVARRPGAGSRGRSARGGAEANGHDCSSRTSTFRAPSIRSLSTRRAHARWRPSARCSSTTEATIEQRAGDEVMAVFGIPRAREDDALRAARSALELQAEIDALLGRARARGARTGRAARRDRDRRGARGRRRGGTRVRGRPGDHSYEAHPPARGGGRDSAQGPAAVGRLGDAVVVERGAARPEDGSLVLGLVEGLAPLPRRLDAPLVDRVRELGALREAFARTLEERNCRLVPGARRSRDRQDATRDRAGDAARGRGNGARRALRLLRRGERPTCRSRRSSARSGRPRWTTLLAGDEHAELISAQAGRPRRRAGGARVGRRDVLGGATPVRGARRRAAARARLRGPALGRADAARPDRLLRRAGVRPRRSSLLGLARPEPARGSAPTGHATRRRGSRRSRAKTARR